MKSSLKLRVFPTMDTDDVFVEKTSVELYHECLGSKPDGSLSKALRHKLEKAPIEQRQRIVRIIREGCAPLFVAARRGAASVVDYLITVCHADVEQRGIYEVHEDNSVHHVTPLWCAAVSGQLAVIKTLLRHRSDIDASSDTGSTPVRSACFMTNVDVVNYLVEQGADIRRANYNGGTCLINSVQSVPLCQFLLSKGADVNAKDIQDKTALHYAIQEHRLETTKVLLEHGADPFAQSRYGDDALQTACLKGAHQIFNYLKRSVTYSTRRLADAHELIGCTFLDEHNETRVAILNWRLAHHMRMKKMPYLAKEPTVPLREAYTNATEFATLDELENIELDVDAMRIQSLMICERVLGLKHKDTLFRLMFRGASYADSLRFKRCIDLWQLALETRVRRFTILHSDTCFTAQALLRLMLDLHERMLEMHVNRMPYNDEVAFKDVHATLDLLSQEVLEIRPLLLVRPIYKKQLENYDRVLKCVTHLIYLGVSLYDNRAELEQLTSAVRPLIDNDIRSACTSDSLLHLSVSRLNVIKSAYFSDEIPCKDIFPCKEVVDYLLECGIRVNARNENRSTALHVAVTPYNYQPELIRVLLEAGAHIDQPNKNNTRAIELIVANSNNRIPVLQFTTLQCLAATAVAKYKIPYRSQQLPFGLEQVLRQHQA